MRFLRSRTIWGVLLILMGILFLLESLGVLAIGGAWALLFVVAGLAFGYTFLEDRANWWAVIPAMTLLGIAALIAVNTYAPRAGETWGASIFLGALSLAFWIIFLTTGMEQWWALIPGGVLLSLAGAIALEPIIAEETFVGLFMLGIGLTFALVYLLSKQRESMSWALIPAGILSMIGIIFFSAATETAALIWPAVLIVIGAYLLLRSLRQRR
ncbi:MAG: hypothetical protein ACP5HG_15190 [Anaerolineae bacterium]